MSGEVVVAIDVSKSFSDRFRELGECSNEAHKKRGEMVALLLKLATLLSRNSTNENMNVEVWWVGDKAPPGRERPYVHTLIQDERDISRVSQQLEEYRQKPKEVSGSTALETLKNFLENHPDVRLVYLTDGWFYGGKAPESSELPKGLLPVVFTDCQAPDAENTDATIQFWKNVDNVIFAGSAPEDDWEKISIDSESFPNATASLLSDLFGIHTETKSTPVVSIPVTPAAQSSLFIFSMDGNNESLPKEVGFKGGAWEYSNTEVQATKGGTWFQLFIQPENTLSYCQSGNWEVSDDEHSFYILNIEKQLSPAYEQILYAYNTMWLTTDSVLFSEEENLRIHTEALQTLEHIARYRKCYAINFVLGNTNKVLASFDIFDFLTTETTESKVIPVADWREDLEVGENYVDICLKENQGETELRCSKKVTITWDITNAFSTTFSFNSVADVTLPYNPFYIKDDTNLVARLRLFYKKATDKYKIESHTHYIYVKSKKNTDIYDTCYSNNITTKNTETILQYEKEVKNKDKIVFNLQDEFHAPHQSNNCRDAIDRITLEIDISQYHLNLIWKCDNKNNPDMWECKRSEQ